MLKCKRPLYGDINLLLVGKMLVGYMGHAGNILKIYSLKKKTKKVVEHDTS